MYEGTLPQTGAAIAVGGTAVGLSWLLAVGLLAVVAGILLTRYGPGRDRA